MKTTLDGIEVEARHPWRDVLRVSGAMLIGLALLAIGLGVYALPLVTDAPVGVESELMRQPQAMWYRHSRSRHLYAQLNDDPGEQLEYTPFLDALDHGVSVHRQNEATREAHLSGVAAQRTVVGTGGTPESHLLEETRDLEEALSTQDRDRLERATEDYVTTLLREGQLEQELGATSLLRSSLSVPAWPGLTLLLVGLAALLVGWRLGPLRIRVTPSSVQIGPRTYLLDHVASVTWWPRPELVLRSGERVSLQGRRVDPELIDALDDAWSRLEPRAPSAADTVVDEDLQELRGRVGQAE